ncbi:TatD family hydrolase [Methanobacterium aggregans]|uniref:TatD family hydrolase n=1 Tax=Methanobacterium aggregans TaxID=1615586 RepID=UPI001AE64CF4|nr:TatD family hydrolase [Methanobacterium aggregans]MBP2046635.1 putative metal-dependent TIM-barrel fold hydrolase [Methanobacterium aggregans]
MIDAHVHADTRPYEDFEKMAVAGVEKAVSCAHDPLRMSTSDVVLDHINRILKNDTKRAAENGLKLYAAVGIHPRSISKDWETVLNELPYFLEKENVVAVGEIGLETTSNIEKEVFKKQLQLADNMNMKVVVHTPRQNKYEVARVTSSILEEMINPSLVQLDHVDNSIVDMAVEHDWNLGLTVQPLKVTPDEAVSMLKEYGVDRFVLDSDMSSSPSDPLSVPKTVHKMKLAGFEDSEIKKVSHSNAAEFYGI